MAEFAHLHLHTEYSLLDGLGRIDDYMQRAVQFGMEHVAITDHGVMYGVLDWYKAARANELNPVIGMEGYMARKGIQDRTERRPYHLVLLAENETGYANLLKLASRSSLEGFYYRPRFDIEMLNEYREGLICTSACLAGPLAAHLLLDEEDRAEAMAKDLLEVFGNDHFFVELQDHGMPEQTKVIPKLLDIANKLHIPVLAANDVHYLDQADAEMQELLVCIQTNRTLDDPNRMKMTSDQLYFKSPDEMVALFDYRPDAISNTVEIASRCNVSFDFGRLFLPRPDLPEGKNAQEYLAELCWEGLSRRYNNITEEIRKRLEYELYVIEQTGFPEYMLIVMDFARFAREREIPFGVRGSAAASIVLYSIGVTDVDPMAHRLVFERFLNLERREMPDIDMDFADNRRSEVIEYAANKYGHDRVAQIITFGTMGAKASVRDVGRAQSWSPGDVNRIARLIPPTLNMTLDRALTESKELRELYETDNQVSRLINDAIRLEGISRHAGTHAAGVVISNDPLVEHIPLQRQSRGSDEGHLLPTTQFPMETVAEIGLLKMDFLGLSNLTILGEAVDIIEESRGESIDLLSIPDGDENTYSMLSSGETFGVFQLESSGMRRYIQDLRPESMAELAALLALYRPGPMQHIPRYCASKHGEESITYPHPDLAEILDETYGVIVYQDQVLLIAQQFAGYTLGEADIMRKAMGKKIPEKMQAERDRFIKGALENGYSEEDAIRIFELIEPFAGYAFNKAHAVCYATVSYQTAYLKANYPAEYMTAILRHAQNHPSGASSRIAASVSECTKLGIEVLRPDINESGIYFQVTASGENPSIRFGLSAIKNVGENAVTNIVVSRADTPDAKFNSLLDLCSSIDLKQVNKRVLESLIKCGACDVWGSRQGLLESLEPVISSALSQQRAAERGQMDLFGGEVVVEFSEPVVIDPLLEVPKKTLLAWEKELAGIYLTENPLIDVQQAARNEGIRFSSILQIEPEMIGGSVSIIGLVSEVRRIVTRNNQAMAIVNVEDLGGEIELVVFPRTYETASHLLNEDTSVLVTGRVDERNDELQIIVEDIKSVEVDTTRQLNEQRTVILTIQLDDLHNGAYSKLQQLPRLLKTFSGDDLLELKLRSSEPGPVRYLRSRTKIDWCRDLEQAVDELFGPGAVSIRDTSQTVVSGALIAS